MKTASSFWLAARWLQRSEREARRGRCAKVGELPKQARIAIPHPCVLVRQKGAIDTTETIIGGSRLSS